MSERRHAVRERPIVSIGNPGCVPRPSLRFFKLPRKELRERSIGVKRPALRVVGAKAYCLLEEWHRLGEAAFVSQRVGKAAVDDWQCRVQLQSFFQLGKRL